MLELSRQVILLANLLLLVVDNLWNAKKKIARFAAGREEKRMSLKPEPIGPVPEETARLAKAVFPEGSTFIKRRDELGTLCAR
jgi:hypothetical protein